MAAERARWFAIAQRAIAPLAIASLAIVTLAAHPAAARTTPWVLVREVGGETRVTSAAGAPGSVLVFALPVPFTPDAVRTDPAALRIVADADAASQPRIAISADLDPCFPAARPPVAIRAPTGRSSDTAPAARPADRLPSSMPSEQPASAAGYAVRVLTPADARRGRLALPAEQQAALRDLLRHGQSLAVIVADDSPTHDPLALAMHGSRILLPWHLRPGAGTPTDVFALTAAGQVAVIAGAAPAASLEVGAVPEYLADDPAPFTAAVLAGAGSPAPVVVFAAPFAPRSHPAPDQAAPAPGAAP